MPAAIPIISVVVAAASAAYGGYKQNEAAEDAKDAARKQAATEQQRLKAKNALDQAATLRNAEIMKGKQRNLLAGSGVDLNDAGGLASLTTGATDQLAAQDISTLNTNLGYNVQDSNTRRDNIINSQPGLGSIIGSSAMNFGSTAMNQYTNYQNNQSAQNLLQQQYGTQQNPNYIQSGNPRF